MTVGQKYTNIAILFHWLTAIFIMVLFPLGWYMVDLEGADKGYYYGLHKSLGFIDEQHIWFIECFIYF